MTSSRSFGCCRSKTWRITSRIGACQACLHLMFMFTDVCACEIRRREVNEACRCACPDGIVPSKVSTSDDACDDYFLISAKSETLLSRPFKWSHQQSFSHYRRVTMMGYPDMTSICFTLSSDDTLSVSLSSLAHLIAKVHENSTTRLELQQRPGCRVYGDGFGASCTGNDCHGPRLSLLPSLTG